MRSKGTSLVIVLVVAVLTTLVAVPLASADTPTDTSALREAVTVDGVAEPVRRFGALP